MSKPIPPEKDREDEGNPSTENQPENEKKLELLEVKQEKGAKTFIYRDSSQTRKRESLWGRLWGEKSRSLE
jgi:hypothetical protein